MQSKRVTVFVALTLLSTIALAQGMPPASTLTQKASDEPQIQFVSQTNFVLSGTAPNFQIRVICEDSFTVNTIYATIRDATQDVQITFDRVRLSGSPFDTDVAPPTTWNVAHQDLTVTIGAESSGYELLSNLDVPRLGVGAGGSFDILGDRAPNTQNTVMSIGAVVETSAAADNNCEVVILDPDDA